MLKRAAQVGLVVLLLVGAAIGGLLASDFLTRPKLPSYAGSPDKPGSIISAEHVGSYPPFVFSMLLSAAGVEQPIAISERPHLYRVSYWSRLADQPIKLSGLVAIPETKSPRGVVVWLHGTNDDRAASVSAPSLNEGVALSGAFAGGGYIYVAPDLPGLGISTRAQTYLHNPSTIEATLDLLRAAETLASDADRPWPNQLYVAGFSQGGHATAVVARELERLNRPNWQLRAAAGIAGAYDLRNITFLFALKGKSMGHAVYLTLVARSYADTYGHPVGGLLTSEATKISDEIVLGTDVSAARARLPNDPRRLFRPDFLASYDAGQSHWFLEAMLDNGITSWGPRSPYRAYYGEEDQDVPPEDSITFVRRARELGGNATAIPVGAVDHFGSVLRAVPQIRLWFDEISETRTAKN
jgi:pimeloyl-ACP methyl ester carboxylesterase